jgi:hypothetical protein
MAPRQSHVAAVSPRQQWLIHAILAPGGRLARPPRILDVVIETLADKDEVGKAEIHGEGDDSGDEAGPNGTYEVCDVADEPDGEEGERYAFCGALLVVFYELGYLGVLALRSEVWACVCRRKLRNVLSFIVHCRTAISGAV